MMRKHTETPEAPPTGAYRSAQRSPEFYAAAAEKQRARAATPPPAEEQAEEVASDV